MNGLFPTVILGCRTATSRSWRTSTPLIRSQPISSGSSSWPATNRGRASMMLPEQVWSRSGSSRSIVSDCGAGRRTMLPRGSNGSEAFRHARRGEHTIAVSAKKATTVTEAEKDRQPIPQERTPVKGAVTSMPDSELSPDTSTSADTSQLASDVSSAGPSESTPQTSASSSSSSPANPDSTSVTTTTTQPSPTKSTTPTSTQPPSQPEPLSLIRRIIPSSLLPPLPKSTKEEGEDVEEVSSISKLMALARPEKRDLTIAIGLLLVSSGVSMLVPLTIGKLIDFFASSSTDTFFGMSFPVAATVLAFTFALGALANTGRAILMRLSGQRIVARVRNQAYLGTLKQEPEFADKGAGDIVSRLGIDTGIVGDSVTSNLSDGLRAVISAVVGVAAMVMISAKLTGVMLAVVPPVSIGAVIYGRYLRKLSNQTQEALGEMSKTAEEKLNAFKTVTAFNAQPIEAELFAKKVDTVFQLARKEAIASGIFFGGSGLTGNLTMLCLLGYGGHLVSKGEISVGDLTSLLIYTGYVGGSVSGLTGFWTGLMKGVGAGTRVFHLLDRKSLIPMGVGRTCPKNRIGEITLENVSFRYPSRREVSVLDGVNLRIEVGKSVAIVGPSGSGKSSIQALLTRYYDPDEGVVRFDGEDIREFTPESWRSRIGIVPQDPVLFTGTVHENIAYGLTSITREEVEQAARQANCDFIWSLPQGFDTPIGKASLSGGQKQRIAVARALVRKPSILLLDEATSALDSGSEAALNSSIDAIMRQHNITVILVAHRLSSIARAEKVVVLEGGKITEEGLYRDLSRREGSRFRSLMAAQLLLEKSKSGADGGEGY